ncbi:hypothetical protein FKM82_028761 [Ascaphus truei]
MNSAVTGQFSVETNCESCSRPSTAEPVNGSTFAPVVIETECGNMFQPPPAVVGDQGHIKPYMSKQDYLNSCMSPLTEMDCPVCFNKYDIYRVPKQLSCKHTFCAVCLKLLLQHDEGTWVITCPVCRASAVVFGGLIGTLQNQESLMSRLGSPECKSENPASSARLEVPSMFIRNSRPDTDEESTGNLRVAAKRLVALLLILLIILIIILQFVYTGILKWVFGCILGVVVIFTLQLCFNTNCRMKLSGTSSNLQKDNYVLSAV